MLTGYLRAHFPSQPVDEYTTEALEETLRNYPPADCRLALLNIAERGERWCSPTDIKAEVKRIREKRIADYGIIQPPADLDPDNVVGYAQWLASMNRRIADGEITAPAELLAGGREHVARLAELTAGAFQRVPDEDAAAGAAAARAALRGGGDRG